MYIPWNLHFKILSALAFVWKCPFKSIINSNSSCTSKIPNSFLKSFRNVFLWNGVHKIMTCLSCFQNDFCNAENVAQFLIKKSKWFSVWKRMSKFKAILAPRWCKKLLLFVLYIFRWFRLLINLSCRMLHWFLYLSHFLLWVLLQKNLLNAIWKTNAPLALWFIL